MACWATPRSETNPLTSSKRSNAELLFYGGFASKRARIVTKRFLKVCPNIQSVRLVGMVSPSNDAHDSSGNGAFSLLPALLASKNQINSLTVKRAKELTLYRLLSHVDKLATLKNLELSPDQEDESKELELVDQSDPPSFQLESLSLNAIAEPELFEHLTSTSFMTLTFLSIALHRMPFDLSSLSPLKTLAVVYRSGAVVAQTLKTVPSSLETLELRFSNLVAGGGVVRWHSQVNPFGDFDSEDDDEHYDSETCAKRKAVRAAREADEKNNVAFGNLLQLLPSQISRLSIAFYPLTGLDEDQEDEFSALLKALRSPRFCPHLSFLDVADERKEDRLVLEPERTSEENRLVAARRRKLYKICKKRNVELGGGGQAWSEKEREEGKMMRAF